MILLDEPFSSLDAGLRWHLRGDVRRLLKGIGVTTILVTHDQDEALTFGDRVAVMRAGAIEQVGTPEEVYGRPATPWVATFVGETNLLAADFAAGTAADGDRADPASPAAASGGRCAVRSSSCSTPGPATVSVASYFGRDTRYEVDVPGAGTVIVRRAGPPEHAPGDAVTVRFAAPLAHGWRAPSIRWAYLTMPRRP